MGFVKETIFLPKRKENASSYINININAVGLYDKDIVYISFLTDNESMKKIYKHHSSGGDIVFKNGYAANLQNYTNVRGSLTVYHLAKDRGGIMNVCKGKENSHAVMYYTSRRYNDGSLADFMFSFDKDLGTDISNTWKNLDNEDLNRLRNKIFDVIIDNTALPIIPEWKEYVVNNLLDNQKIRKINVYNFIDDTNISDKIGYLYMCVSDRGAIQALVQNMIITGLNNNDITIDGCTGVSNMLLESTNISRYIDNFGSILCDNVVNKFTPLFNPTKEQLSDEIKDRTAISATHSHIYSYTAQENAEEAITRSMDINKHTILSGSCGSGKSGMATLSIDAHARKHNHVNYSAIIMCPGTMPTEWIDTIKGTVPFSDVYHIKNMTDLLYVKEKIDDPYRKRPLYAVMTYGIAKNGYDEHPALKYNKHKNNLTCPYCGEQIVNRSHDNSERLMPVDALFLSKDDSNSFCRNCGESLWSASTKRNIGNWIKINKLGWVLKDRIPYMKNYINSLLSDSYTVEHVLKVSDKKKLMSIVAILNDIDADNINIVMRFSESYPVARYIRQKMRHYFDYAVMDEAHELAGKSLQHQAFSDVIQSCWRSLLLTGTLSNGYASGLFNILFKTQTAKVIEDGFGYKDEKEFVEKYGVLEETTIRVVTGYPNCSYMYDNNGNRCPEGYRVNKKTTKTKAIAGVSPLIFSNYLINNTVFLKQEDITQELVPYREIPMPINMDTELQERYDEIMNIVSQRISSVGKRAIKNFICYMDMMLDQPYGLDSMFDTNGQDVIIEAKELDDEKIRNKEQALIDLCIRKKNAGEKILIYVHWTGKLNIQNRLKDILEANNVNAEIMTNDIKLDARQKWLNDKSESVDAIIVNPRLVDVGLNLLPYTTIVFYEIGNQLSVIRQASKRSWRINQTHPVEVYFMYYRNTVQEQLIGIISQKLKAAIAVEGNFSAEGLSSISDDTDIMTAIANNIANNRNISVVQDNFEEIGSNDAGEARKKRAESQIRLGQRETFAYTDISMYPAPKKAKINTKEKINLIDIINLVAC